MFQLMCLFHLEGFDLLFDDNSCFEILCKPSSGIFYTEGPCNSETVLYYGSNTESKNSLNTNVIITFVITG